MGTYLPGTGLLGCKSWCGAGTPCSGDSPLKFLPTTRGCGASPFPVCTLATSLGGCGFFNSIAVRLPFSSISDGSEWWWFYILFVILMCLCEEASHVGLCHHLDWRSPFNFFLSKFIFRISCWHGSNKIISICYKFTCLNKVTWEQNIFLFTEFRTDITCEKHFYFVQVYFCTFFKQTE